MRYFLRLLALLFYFNLINISIAFGYRYEEKKIGSHVIHVVTISPGEFDIEFVKAYDQIRGRETVSSISERSDAVIAINAGFFEIGKNRDGVVSGTLIVKNKIYGLRSGKHSVFSYRSKNHFEIKKIEFVNDLILDKSIIRIPKVNEVPLPNETVLFTYAYGNHSLTKFSGRQEIAFDEFGNFIKLYAHGNCPIPPKGFIVSMPYNKSTCKIDKSKIKLKLDRALLSNKEINVVSVIPILIQNGKIEDKLFEKKSEFYSDQDARTAIGIKQNGEIVLVVVENCYTKDLSSITLREVKSLLAKNAAKYCFQYKKLDLRKLSINDLLHIVKKEFAFDAKVKGFTILELANFMKDLGCISAANFDGGGSSILWINGKVKNRAVGDRDESIGELVERPVSDAIVFKRKKHI